MRRLTSVFVHVLPTVAALGLIFTVPMLAQSTPRPSRPAMTAPAAPTPHSVTEPMSPPSATSPTPAAPQQGRQPGQGQQGQPGQQGLGTTPPASAPRADPPRAPFLGNSPNSAPMPASTNIKLDLTITDTFTGAPVKKTVSLIVLSQNSGMIRTASPDGWAILNIDAVAAAFAGGQVSVRMTFEYSPAIPKDSTNGRPPRLNESITVALQDGKPLIVSQSADPATDRKVIAELTATILK